MAEPESEDDRLPTGVAGLDAILLGGLLRGGIYLIDGTPGTGKTVLASEICFRHAANGGRSVFVTSPAEPQEHLLRNLKGFSFFDAARTNSTVRYLAAPSAAGAMMDGADVVARAVSAHQATLLVIDGIESDAAPGDALRFVRAIQDSTDGLQTTIVLLARGDGDGSAGRVMADGVIHLDDSGYEHRRERGLQVRKFRGSDYLPGRHSFRITKDGVVTYPRIETVYATPPVRDRYRPLRMSTGIEGLDLILRGGLPSETSNAIYGPTGSGKTTLGLQFIGASSAVEPGLFFGMYETPERLHVKAAALGIDLARLEDEGHVEIVWRPQGEIIIDDLGHQIVDAVRRRGVKRLFIDGFGGLLESAAAPDRMNLFISTLSNTLRALNATTVLTMEARDIIGREMTLPAYGMSSLLEGLIVLRYVELGGKVLRLITVTKIRDSDFDPSLREVRMSDRGLVVGGAITGAEALLSGFGRTVTSGAA